MLKARNSSANESIKVNTQFFILNLYNDKRKVNNFMSKIREEIITFNEKLGYIKEEMIKKQKNNESIFIKNISIHSSIEMKTYNKIKQIMSISRGRLCISNNKCKDLCTNDKDIQIKCVCQKGWMCRLNIFNKINQNATCFNTRSKRYKQFLIFKNSQFF